MSAWQPPARVTLDNGTVLRLLCPEDAELMARAVGDSLEHLRPWMPWANEQSADPSFQRDRISKQPQLAARGEEWQYGLFDADEAQVLGSFGLMTRRGPGTLEIGYWLHVDATGHGHASRAAQVCAEIAATAPGVRRVLIHCDEANTRSAAIPARLGFVKERVTVRRPEAPGETGREEVWVRETAVA